MSILACMETSWPAKYEKLVDEYHFDHEYYGCGYISPNPLKEHEAYLASAVSHPVITAIVFNRRGEMFVVDAGS